MLTKAQIKFVQSLQDKKSRSATGFFVVEGSKNVAELLDSKIKVNTLFATTEWLITVQDAIHPEILIETCSDKEMEKLSALPSAAEVIAIACIPELEELTYQTSDFIIALDTIQDPGNLGTIIRIADWYHAAALVCSQGCADPYSPKVVQASMGSIFRVKIVQAELEPFIVNSQPVSVYGAMLHGENLYDKMIGNGILLIGNEGHGISEHLKPLITDSITIPKLGEAESLNAAVATAIICDAHARALHQQ